MAFHPKRVLAAIGGVLALLWWLDSDPTDDHSADQAYPY